MECLKKLFTALVFNKHNVQVLHWKVTGIDFDPAHSLFDGYVATLNIWIDHVGEMLLSLGENPLTLPQCVEYAMSDDVNIMVLDANIDYSSKDAYNALTIIFNQLMDLCTEVEQCEDDDIPEDVISELHTFHNWLRTEGNYKNIARNK